MDFTRKTAESSILFFIVFFITFPLRADPLPDDALDLDENYLDEYYFIEDYFLNDELLHDEGYLIYEIPHFIYELRSFDDIFSGLSQSQKARVFSNEGLKHFFEKDGSPVLLPDPDSEINILNSVMKKEPSNIIEVLTLVPYSERELDILDIYNALGRIEEIKNHSVYFGGRDLYVFTETTRLESAENRMPVSDPPP